VTIIRVAKRKDLREIVSLHRQAGESQGQLDPRLAPAASDSVRFGRVLEAMIGRRWCRVLVAEGGTGLVGYAVGSPVDNEPFTASRFGLVGGLNVEQGQRGRGTEDALLEALNGWFKEQGLAVTHVDVSCSDLAAQRFWERRGFGRFLDQLRWDGNSESYEHENSPLVVRPARSGDWEAVLLLWKEMMDVHSAIDPRLSIAPDWRHEVARSVERWLRDGDSRLVVAEVADDVIGFALGGLVYVTLGLKPSMHGQVAHLCVGANWRRRGIGRRLFWALRDWLVERSVPSIHLYVSPVNPVSQHFWRALGFENYISRLWCDLV
jgi:ribosomal protein S18 acetylase RimI-like enzyme